MKRFLICFLVLVCLCVSASAISYDEFLDLIGSEVGTDESYTDFLARGFDLVDVETARSMLGVGVSVPADSLDLEVLETPIQDSFSGSASLQNVPSSGSAYSDPQLIYTEYAEAESGSLLSILYSLFGRPVRAYHYRWQSSTSQGYNVYSVETLDYDANWFASVAVFCLVLFCVFKLGGVLLSKT